MQHQEQKVHTSFTARYLVSDLLKINRIICKSLCTGALVADQTKTMYTLGLQPYNAFLLNVCTYTALKIPEFPVSIPSTLDQYSRRGVRSYSIGAGLFSAARFVQHVALLRTRCRSSFKSHMRYVVQHVHYKLRARSVQPGTECIEAMLRVAYVIVTYLLSC